MIKGLSIAACAAVITSFSYIYFTGIAAHQNQVETITLNTSLPSISQAVNEQLASAIREEVLVSYLPDFRDSSVIQLVQNALPKKQILDLPEEEQTNTVALVDKVIVIPTVQRNDGQQAADEARRTTMGLVHEHQPSAPTVAIVDHVKEAAKDSMATKVASSAGFTIQLVASHKKSDVDRFKRSSSVYAGTTIRQFTNQKGNWYILTIGEYSTRAEALKKASSLPKSLAKLNPWVRPVSGLKSIG